MRTPEEWHTELHKRCPDLMSVNFLKKVPITSNDILAFVNDIQREAYRQALTDAEQEKADE